LEWHLVFIIIKNEHSFNAFRHTDHAAALSVAQRIGETVEKRNNISRLDSQYSKVCIVTAISEIYVHLKEWV